MRAINITLKKYYFDSVIAKNNIEQIMNAETEIDLFIPSSFFNFFIYVLTS